MSRLIWDAREIGGWYPSFLLTSSGTPLKVFIADRNASPFQAVRVVRKTRNTACVTLAAISRRVLSGVLLAAQMCSVVSKNTNSSRRVRHINTPYITWGDWHGWMGSRLAHLLYTDKYPAILCQDCIPRRIAQAIQTDQTIIVDSCHNADTRMVNITILNKVSCGTRYSSRL